jgi:hypothetical protein
MRIAKMSEERVAVAKASARVVISSVTGSSSMTGSVEETAISLPESASKLRESGSYVLLDMKMPESLLINMLRLSDAS